MKTIRAIAVLLLTLTAGCQRATDLPTAQKFQQAEGAFAAASTPAEFLHVAGLYQELLDSGFVSGAVLYNQGNALMRAGERGRAIAAYRQAKRYRPRDPYLEANLNNALRVRNESAPDKTLLDQIFFWQRWLSYPETFMLLTALLGVTLACALLARTTARRSLFRRAAFGGVLLCVVVAISTAIEWYEVERVEHGVVIAGDIVARKGDSESYEPAFTKPIVEGTEFVVSEHRGNWMRIRVGRSGEGWIPETDAVVY